MPIVRAHCPPFSPTKTTQQGVLESHVLAIPMLSVPQSLGTTALSAVVKSVSEVSWPYLME